MSDQPVNATQANEQVEPTQAKTSGVVVESLQGHLTGAIGEAFDTVAPVWPLQDYVAVNPYFGIRHRKFMDARSFLKVFSDCEMLMPIDFYAEQFQNGQFTAKDVSVAISEMKDAGFEAPAPVDKIVKRLRSNVAVRTTLDQPAPEANPDRQIRTVAEIVTKSSGVNWVEAIRDEVAGFCASHYDDGQATWTSPWKGLPLYEAWQKSASINKNLESLGLSEFCSFVNDLPSTPEAAIEHLLGCMNVPAPLWSTVLLSQAFSVPGWSAWAKYQEAESGKSGGQDFVALLAIRLAYDAALYLHYQPQIAWSDFVQREAARFPTPTSVSGKESMLRYTLLKASEIGYRRNLLSTLEPNLQDAKTVNSAVESVASSKEVQRKLAQMVFCIDVRSERIRRQLESVSESIETFGFAGFFAMPIEFVSLGEPEGVNHLPVLLKPQFKLHESLSCEHDEPTTESTAVDNRVRTRSWRKLWRSFQTSAVGCFSFVETTGLFFGVKLANRLLGFKSLSSSGQTDGVSEEQLSCLAPSLDQLEQQGVTFEQQVDLAQGMLNGLGLKKNFARLVVLCGHASQTDNNPLAAGLDCGACGGHSGEPNARFAAMLLNQQPIRSALAERGIDIPADTHFLGGVHNTTTDQIEFFDLANLPETHATDLADLTGYCQTAGQQTCLERLPVVNSKSIDDLLQRAIDWSEVRPEWGLTGNAAFIVGPRELTKGINLDGRSFLHSYDHQTDPEGAVLEAIMTAPMVVANWINMQYYASTVDNHHFGSGNKTIHNVVGRFGVLSGNGGDLMTGLPWQSLHTGDDYQHLPLRLQVVIAAPRESIQRVIDNHELVANLITNEWSHLVALEDGIAYRFTTEGVWEQIS